MLKELCFNLYIHVFCRKIISNAVLPALQGIPLLFCQHPLEGYIDMKNTPARSIRITAQINKLMLCLFLLNLLSSTASAQTFTIASTPQETDNAWLTTSGNYLTFEPVAISILFTILFFTHLCTKLS
jgi:hypothetical protein